MRPPSLALKICLLFGPYLIAQPQLPIRVEDFAHDGADGVTLVKDPLAPVSFRLPKGWILIDGVRWGKDETTLTLGEARSNLRASFYYQYPLENPRASDPDAALKQFMESKIAQRRDREGLNDYHVREDSIQRRMIAGHPALSFQAEFIRPRDHVAMKEYVLRLIGGQIKAHFFISGPADEDLASFATRLDVIAQTLAIPPM